MGKGTKPQVTKIALMATWAASEKIYAQTQKRRKKKLECMRG